MHQDPPPAPSIHYRKVLSLRSKPDPKKGSSFMEEHPQKHQAQPLIPVSVPNRNCGFSPKNNNNAEIMSPNMLNFPSLVLSPVTPLIKELFNKSSSSTSASSNSNSHVVEEEREIAEMGFYLHLSPILTPRDSEPRLLPLFSLRPN
ncbi:hypothetical protein BVC80_8653g9 [Macleaya cordata]|uniref:VQ n=1 Tax=Macleaya cordata TaxID=56857 RepID=A0A200Q8A4_MACCD|nr:hypothetical protein BVC80_8653g9 [Macleaya cordata]